MLRRVMMANTQFAAQAITFDPAKKHSQVVLSTDQKSASCAFNAAHRYAACTLPKNSGRWQFEMLVDDTGPVTSSGNITIGLMHSTTTPASTYPGFAGGCGLWTRQNAAASRLYAGANEQDYSALPAVSGNILSVGDRLTVAVDFDTKLVAYFKNGVAINSATVAALDPASSGYVPAVKLWGYSAAPTKVSIPSLVSYPVDGYSGWS